MNDLEINIQAAKIKNDPLGHVIFFGPPGLGKTTLAFIVANELGSNFKMITGTNLSNKELVKDILFGLSFQDVLFIDEIHALRQPIEELLYSPMQDFHYDNIPIEKFTLIGATTTAGNISKPLLDRMVHQYELSLYRVDELAFMLWLITSGNKDILYQIAKRSRGVPRIARNLYRSIDNQRIVDGDEEITEKHINMVFNRKGIDSIGLDRHDYQILQALYETQSYLPYGQMGAEYLSLYTNIDKKTLEYLHEPYLLRLGFINRTPKGRIITKTGIEFLKKKRG